MASECGTVQYLKQLVSHHSQSDPGLACAAKATLDIISDINEYSMTAFDLEALHDIVSELAKSGHHVILTHLTQGAPDCAICAALEKKVRNLGVQFN